MTQNWSFWEKDLYFNEIDYLIIGAGIVGVTTSIFLKRKFPEAKIIIVEKKFPGLGASTKNAGFACFGSVTEILDDIDTNGELKASQLLKMRWRGLSLLKSLVSEKEMSYIADGSHELFLEETEEMSYALGKLKYVNELACDALKKDLVFKEVRNTTFSSLEERAISSHLEGRLNPAEMMHALQLKAIKMGIKTLFGIDIKSIQNQKAISFQGDVINAKKIVICNNGFAKNLIDIKDLEMVRNQVLVTDLIPKWSCKGTFHMNQGYIYFREYMGRLLIGGARNLMKEEETTGKFGPNEKIISYLKSLVKEKILPDQEVRFSYEWSGILGVGTVKIPIIRKINAHLYAGIRLGGMGVAIGSHVGKELAEKIAGDSL